MKTRSPIACVLLPELPIAAHHTGARAAPDSESADAPRAVHRGKGTQARIVCRDTRAATAGVKVGQTVAAARARAPGLESVLLDPAKLAEAQRRVVASLVAVSPRVVAANATRFWVEPLGGARWCRAAAAAVAGLGPVAIGIGSTATIAYAAALSAPSRIVSRREERAFLDAQPVTVLEIDAEPRAMLDALALRTVGALRGVDPIALGARLGPAVAEARRRADGDDPRGPSTPRLAPDDAVEIELDEPVEALEPIVFLIRPACERLAAVLRARDRGVTCARLVLACEVRDDGGRAARREHVVEARTASPIADGRTLLELIRTVLERDPIPGPARRLVLTASASAERRDTGGDLFRGQSRDGASQEVVLQRLRGRFGGSAVRRAARVERAAYVARAAWSDDPAAAIERGEAHPWRRIDPQLVEGPGPSTSFGAALVEGPGPSTSPVVRMGRVERVSLPWWNDGRVVRGRFAWAEVEGGVLVLLRAREDGEWEAIAWMD